MKSYSSTILLIFIKILIYTYQLESEWWINSNAIDLTSSNFMDEISKSSQFTVVKFYTTWCKYCKQLHEVYDKVAEEVKKLNNQEVKVVLSRIECDSNMDIPVMYGIYSYPEVVMFYEGQPISQFKGKRNVNFMMFWIRKSLPYIKFDVIKGEVNENTIENIKEVSNNDEDEENKGSEEIELTKEEVDTINSQLKSLEKNIFEKEVILEELLLEKREYSYLILYIVLFIIILLSFFILLYIIIKGLRKKEKSI